MDHNYPLTSRDRVSLAAFLAVAMTGAVIVGSGCCMRTVTPAQQTHESAMDAYARTVRISALCMDGNGGGGSGVRIGGSTILTAKHVVDCGASELMLVTVTDYNGEAYIATLDGDSPADIARLDGLLMPEMPRVAIAEHVLGETLCATFTYPEWGRRCGEVWPSADDTDVHLNLVGEQGNSGGPVWDARGRLVGLVVTLRFCQGTIVPQVCNAGMTTLAPRRWLAAP